MYFYGTPTVKIIDSYDCSWDSFLCAVAMFNLDKVVFASSCYVLFCRAWLLSHRGWLFSIERQKENEHRKGNGKEEREGAVVELGGVEGGKS